MKIRIQVISSDYSGMENLFNSFIGRHLSERKVEYQQKYKYKYLAIFCCNIMCSAEMSVCANL